MSEIEEYLSTEGEEDDISEHSVTESRRSVRFGDNVEMSDIVSDQPEEEQSPSSPLSSAESMVETFRPGSFVLRKKLPHVPDFFLTLGTVPSIDEISLDPSMDVQMTKRAADDESSKHGEEEEVAVPVIEPPKTIQEEPKIDEAAVEEEEQAEEEQTETESSEISELQFDFSSEEEEITEVRKKDDEMEALEVLFESDTKKALFYTADEDVIAKLFQLEQQRQLQKDVTAFVDRLITSAVETVEYVDPNDQLRENLDKKRLLKALIQAVYDMQLERTTNEFLHRKCVDFFRRNKKLRPITPDAEETYNEEMKKYNYAMDSLDELLGRESENKDLFSKRIAILEEEESIAKEELQEQVQSLQNFIKKTFSKRSSEHLDSFILKRLKEISLLSKEISSVLLVLLRYNDTMSKIDEQQAKLEDLGDGLKLHQYISLQTEAIQLSKKLEERNEDLERFRSQFVNHTHALAHIKERQIMLFHKVQALDRDLDIAQNELVGWREYINDLKIKRIRITTDIRERSFQNGLLEMPALMLEFDTTVDRIAELKRNIGEFKQTSARLESRLKRAEMRHYQATISTPHSKATEVSHSARHRSN